MPPGNCKDPEHAKTIETLNFSKFHEIRNFSVVKATRANICDRQVYALLGYHKAASEMIGVVHFAYLHGLEFNPIGNLTVPIGKFQQEDQLHGFIGYSAIGHFFFSFLHDKHMQEVHFNPKEKQVKKLTLMQTTAVSGPILDMAVGKFNKGEESVFILSPPDPFPFSECILSQYSLKPNNAGGLEKFTEFKISIFPQLANPTRNIWDNREYLLISKN